MAVLKTRAVTVTAIYLPESRTRAEADHRPGISAHVPMVVTVTLKKEKGGSATTSSRPHLIQQLPRVVST